MQAVLTRDGYLHVFAATEDLVPPSHYEAPVTMPPHTAFGAYTDAAHTEAKDGDGADDGGDARAASAHNMYAPDGSTSAPPPPPPPRSGRASPGSGEPRRHLSPAVVEAEDGTAPTKVTTNGPLYSVRLGRSTIKCVGATRAPRRERVANQVAVARYRPDEDYFAFELTEKSKTLVVFSSSTQCVCLLPASRVGGEAYWPLCGTACVPTLAATSSAPKIRRSLRPGCWTSTP